MRTAEDIFGFVIDPILRRQLSEDLSELHSSMKQGNKKAALVLIGSLIECALYYHIDQLDSIKNAIPRFDKRDAGLSDLLQWARTHEIIDENLFRLAEPIRDYRNLIHPRVQLRLKVSLSENLVQIGYNVLLEVVRSVNVHNTVQQSKNLETFVAARIRQVCHRTATKADYYVYVPIVKKYGTARAGLIIERSLRASRKRKKKNAVG